MNCISAQRKSSFCIGEGPENRPFRDLRSVPKASRPREQVINQWSACTRVLSLRKAELGFFHFLEIVIGWLVPSAGQKIPLAENRFLYTCNGAEDTKEKCWQCFTCTNLLRMPWSKLSLWEQIDTVAFSMFMIGSCIT
jgi:hypothetical protein